MNRQPRSMSLVMLATGVLAALTILLAVFSCRRTTVTTTQEIEIGALRSPTHDTSTPRSTVAVTNATALPTTVYVAFGSDSVISPVAWAFCSPSSALACSFPLAAKASMTLPLNGHYLNATMAFGAAVGCGSTKAELNLNNPTWYDTADVSMVDGYSNRIMIEAADAKHPAVKLGPPLGLGGNEKVYGLFPLGCDICTSRQNPPCGILPGKGDCKAGTQYAPAVPCQYQGPTLGGGSAYIVTLTATTQP